MKHLLSIFLLAVVIGFLTSCDGRDRKQQSPETVLKEDKLLDSFNEQIISVPKHYAEKVTDTIYANGYRIYMKQYTDETRFLEVKNDNITTVYKDFNVDLKVTKDDNIIFNQTLNIEDLAIQKSLSELNLKHYYLKNFWIKTDDFKTKETPQFLVEFHNPKTKDSTMLIITPFKDNFKVANYNT